MNINTLLLDAGESLKWDAMFPLKGERVLLYRATTNHRLDIGHYGGLDGGDGRWVLIENKQSKDISHDEAIRLQEEDGWLKVGL